MRWISSLSEASTLDAALNGAVASVREQLGGQTPDLLLVFVSHQFISDYDTIPKRLQAELSPRVLLGCSGGGVIGEGREVEGKPSVALTAAVLPEVDITPFRVAEGSLPGLDVSPRQWRQLAGVSPLLNPGFILLADPFSIRVDHLLMGLDYGYPRSAKVGGMASGSQQPGESALILNSVCYRSGAVGVALSGNVALDTLVAQGCRPIGKPMCITACDRNILTELDGQRPLDILRRLYVTLAPSDRALFQQALFLGLVMDPMKSHFTQGDFLIRNIAGLDPERGILAIGSMLRKGQLVQFHLRDAQTSADDLRQLLTTYAGRPARDHVSGALLFSCLGRGEHLFGQNSHDSRMLQQTLGPLPVSGFFCNGEIGPVGGTTYLHGYTSCFALFRPLDVPATAVVAARQTAVRPV